MITYELCLLYRIMPKTELVSSLKRTAHAIYDKGGILRKLENLGTRDTPFKMSAHDMVHRKASYFVYEFNIPPTKLEYLHEELGRDVDIIRRNIYKKNLFDETHECTLHEEMLPVPYRKEVQELVKEARKLDKPKFEYGNNLTYYPFQK